jgi:hypothetical protein
LAVALVASNLASTNFGPENCRSVSVVWHLYAEISLGCSSTLMMATVPSFESMSDYEALRP